MSLFRNKVIVHEMFSLAKHFTGELAEFNHKPMFSKVHQAWYFRKGVSGPKCPDIFW